MKLYGYWRSSSSWRVRIALHLKGLTFDNVPVHLVRDGGEQNQPEYLELNPLAQVPTLELEHEGRLTRLTQSLAIIDYLDARFPEPPLLPRDRLARARALQIAEICNSGMQPLHNSRVLAEVEKLGGDRTLWCQSFLPRGFSAIEQIIAESGGAHAVGDAITVADVCLIPQLFPARRYSVPLDSYSHIHRVAAAVAEHPAFVAADPESQPDAHG